MKRSVLSYLALAALLSLQLGCETAPEEQTPDASVSPEVEAKLAELGFLTQEGLFKVEGGYIVEHDIFIPEERLANMQAGDKLALPSEEQYSTNNLVTGLPRLIQVYVSPRMSTKVFQAVDDAIDRYNAEGLQLTFSRTSDAASADISIEPSPWYYPLYGILGSGGFPTADGDPWNRIYLTRSYFDRYFTPDALATIVAHEIGHCIGFRHTEYMDRSYSCNGDPVNEGAGSIGANHIPGTPTGPDPNSWMLSCIGSSTNRPFNANDRTALNYLY
jgi:hypothetical protein